jgi:hypothetical protein
MINVPGCIISGTEYSAIGKFCQLVRPLLWNVDLSQDIHNLIKFVLEITYSSILSLIYKDFPRKNLIYIPVLRVASVVLFLLSCLK